MHHGGNKLHHCPVDAIKLSAGKIMCCNGCPFGGRYPSVGCHGLMLGGDEFTVGAGRYSQDHYFTQSVGKRKIGELCLSLTDE